MRLRLISLHCTTTEDDHGEDEQRLLVNGVQVWGAESPGLNNGDTADLAAVPLIDFNTRARVELFDDDSPDDDDLLGRFYVGRSQLGQGELEYKFTEDDADYTLTYEVLD
ncbi:hypothetical protein [Streptomyces vietnamensis]|uniref:Uncharacterized protein n=1 Tax=Streptomyces vietnamensis TaxID=362257 RepID=A0A0B5I4C4_9ACTN|nr:hypothetical protein [Streptomyces vietnamensis]AJF67416.1 hypothetical protein SVTN_26610 [Streptomyces vietnamensis]